MTVLEVIQKSTEFLARKGVDSPRLQIELLMAHVLGVPRLQLYLSFDRVLTNAELDKLRELVRRRGNREPLQHLLGTVSFCGYELIVNRDVFIPRPETELLAELAWTWIEKSKVDAPTVLDIGTGSGCIAIAVAIRCPRAVVTAVDISEAAITVARTNAAKHNVQGRIEFLVGDCFEPVPQGKQFNLILTNPPYIPTGDIPQLEPEVRDHDPRVAFDGGADGLVLIRRIARDGLAYLARGGRLMLEFGDGQSDAVCGVFNASGWAVENLVKDDRGTPRILVARQA